MRPNLVSALTGLALFLASTAGAAASPKATFTIKGMTCGGCVAAVKLQLDRKSTRLNSSHIQKSRMPSSA